MIPEPHKIYKSDKYFNLDLSKISNILCRIERFNSHTSISISVAHHSLHCLYLAKEKYPNNLRLQQLSLFHDVSEAYYGDIPTYIKRKLGDEAKYQLNHIDQEIFDLLKIPYPCKSEKELIKEVDLTALALEAKTGFPSDIFNSNDWPTPFTWDTYYIDSLIAIPFYGVEEKLLTAFKEYQSV